MKFFIKTFGCQMNQYDSEILAALLTQKGYEEANNENEADVIILNSCAVRQKAEDKMYSLLGRLKSMKKQNPNLLLGVGGCVPQQPGVAQEIRKRIPEVDFVFGTHNVCNVPELIAQAQRQEKPIVEVVDEPLKKAELVFPRRAAGVNAFVTISSGCNNYCSYCIVPYTRGPEISRSPEAIVKEVQEAVQEGFREITLLGQNVNSYGKDLGVSIRFPDLLEKINAIDGVSRIRFVTSHPKDFDRRLILAIRDLSKVCEHVHLPVQSGSNRILAQMNRRYSREQYMELVEEIRQENPEVSITTDLIVGFPGESDQDFADTMDLVEKLHFDQAFTFVYSPRPGTAAYGLKNEVPSTMKKERIQQLIRVQNRLTLMANQKLVGKCLEVLVEGPSKTDPAQLSGRTRTNKVVVFNQKPGIHTGELVEVCITGAGMWNLFGRL
ncbi:MAG: tRNA (N6-isopentenyl adenosine(37)-C2)-methylthiotransferase MiaB [Clostridia bacterium]|nr:tRNA (N6-isopentenyl adenosine(37)-C2)-methylthiotransferase MiaB [Clostridia bacterium]